MTFKHFTASLGLLAGMAALPLRSAAAPAHCCVAGKPTAASATWNFRQEASGLLKDIQEDATHARSRAAALESFATNPYLDWESHAGQLVPLRHEINDMGGKLCRLEQIRRVVAPWQRKAIDRIAPMVRLMADNAEDAVNYVNQYEGRLWVPSYRRYLDNLYGEASGLSQSVRSFEEYAAAHREDLRLGKALGVGPHS